MMVISWIPFGLIFLIVVVVVAFVVISVKINDHIIYIKDIHFQYIIINLLIRRYNTTRQTYSNKLDQNIEIV